MKISTPLAGGSSKNSKESKNLGRGNEGAQNFVQDITLIQQRIAELGDAANPMNQIPATPQSTSSPFVSGIRALADTSGEWDDKVKCYEKLLQKLGELDRLILKKTAPDPTDGLKPRRLSRNSDLVHLPTHLHLIDRILDLHTQSKRVTIIKTSGEANSSSIASQRPAPSPANPEVMVQSSCNCNIGAKNKEIEQLQKEIVELRNTNQQMTNNLKETKGKSTVLEQKLSSLEAENAKIKLEMNEMQSRINQNVNSLSSSNSSAPVSASVSSSTSNEMKLLEKGREEDQKKLLEAEKKIDQLQLQVIQLEEKEKNHRNETNQIGGFLRDEQNRRESLLQILREKTSLIHSNMMTIFDDSIIGVKAPEDIALLARCHRMDYPLDGESCRVLQDFDDKLETHMSRLCDSIILLNSLKDSLENEISSYNLERRILNNDLQSVQSQYEAMKAAYHALESENIVATRKLLSQNPSSDNEDASKNYAELQKRIEELQNMVVVMESESAKLQKRLQQYEKLPARIADLEVKISEQDMKINQIKTEKLQIQAEMESYKQLTRTLQEKLKSLGSRNNDGRDFLDSFEEVMRDEMMTMKTAFEAKLKVAKDEAENATKKHLQEIQRMQFGNKQK